MKKLIALLLALSMVLCLAACGDKNPDEPNAENNNPSSPVQDDKPEDDVKDKAPSGGSIQKQLEEAGPSPEEDFFVVDSGNGEYELIEYMGDDEIVVLPDTVGGYPITRIGSYVFANNETLKGIRLSDSVTIVDEFAFPFCTSLEVVICGNNVTTIGASAFQKCGALHTIVLNNGLISLGNLTFSDCDSLTTLEIPDSVTEIDGMLCFGSEDNITIVAAAGSAAEAYANEAGVAFKAK